MSLPSSSADTNPDFVFKVSEMDNQQSSILFKTPNVHSCHICQKVVFRAISGGVVADSSLTVAEAVQQSSEGNCPFCTFVLGWRFLTDTPVSKSADCRLNVTWESPWEGSPHPPSIKFCWRPRMYGCDFVNPAYPYVLADDPAAKSAPCPSLNDHPGADWCFGQAKKWLDDCHDLHSACRTRLSCPRRVIDVGNDGLSPRLHPTNQRDGLIAYCCLSYCWGGDQSVTTTLDTLADYVKSIPVDRLPCTIRDAIRATAKLGLRYLWIDALCIIQDDPVDKMREIANMPYIFKGARVTLLAASAANSTAGFLQPRNNLGRVEEDTCFKLPFSDAGGAKGSVILAQKPLFKTKSEPVDNRAWILQEQLLSPRLLIFGSERIWWSCFTSFCADGGQNDLRATRIGKIRHLFSTSAMTQNALETNAILRDARWEAIVEEYTQRKRTEPDDMLPAISGIAQDYQHNAEFIYLAGLWKHSFPHNLLWFNLKSQQRANDRTVSLCKRPSKYRAPTWSWASIDDPVKFTRREQSNAQNPVSLSLDYRPDLIAGEVALLSELAPHGEVKSGTIKIQARVRKMLLKRNQWNLRLYDPNFTGFQPPGEFYKDAAEDVYLSCYKEKHSLPVLCLQIVEAQGIVLVTESRYCFRRVGYYQFDTSICEYDTRASDDTSFWVRVLSAAMTMEQKYQKDAPMTMEQKYYEDAQRKNRDIKTWLGLWSMETITIV